MGCEAMKARAAHHELQTARVWSAAHNVSPREREITLSACGPASPWQAGMAAEKLHIAWRAGLLVTALLDECGGLESPHDPVTRAAQTPALTFLPCHSRWCFCHPLHQVVRYSLAPGSPSVRAWLQQRRAAGPPRPCDSALPTPLPYHPAAVHEGQMQQQDFSKSFLALIPAVFLTQTALPGANRFPADQGYYSIL